MPNTSDWDSPEFLMDLGIALFTAAQANKALPVPVKEAVEAYLKERGWKTSFDAVRQHVQKLRKARDTNALTAIQAAGAGSATTTPRKKATTTPRKRKNAKNTAAEEDDVEDEKMKLKQENDDDGADELVSPSPMKRAKRTPKPEPKEEELEAEIAGEI